MDISVPQKSWPWRGRQTKEQPNRWLFRAASTVPKGIKGPLSPPIPRKYLQPIVGNSRYGIIVAVNCQFHKYALVHPGPQLRHAAPHCARSWVVTDWGSSGAHTYLFASTLWFLPPRWGARRGKRPAADEYATTELPARSVSALIPIPCPTRAKRGIRRVFRSSSAKRLPKNSASRWSLSGSTRRSTRRSIGFAQRPRS